MSAVKAPDQARYVVGKHLLFLFFLCMSLSYFNLYSRVGLRVSFLLRIDKMFWKELFIRFTVRVLRVRLSVVCFFPFWF